MRKFTILAATTAALALSACGGSKEADNVVVTENISEEVVLNDVALGNDTFGNDLSFDNAADTTDGANALTAVDNSQ